jgi:hypothetical protein
MTNCPNNAAMEQHEEDRLKIKTFTLIGLDPAACSMPLYLLLILLDKCSTTSSMTYPFVIGG